MSPERAAGDRNYDTNHKNRQVWDTIAAWSAELRPRL